MSPLSNDFPSSVKKAAWPGGGYQWIVGLVSKKFLIPVPHYVQLLHSALCHKIVHGQQMECEDKARILFTEFAQIVLGQQMKCEDKARTLHRIRK